MLETHFAIQVLANKGERFPHKEFSPKYEDDWVVKRAEFKFGLVGISKNEASVREHPVQNQKEHSYEGVFKNKEEVDVKRSVDSHCAEAKNQSGNKGFRLK